MRPSPHAPPVKLDSIPGELPRAVVPENADLAQVAAIAVKRLNELSPDCLTDNALFRDFLTLTDSRRTFYSRDKVYTVLKELIALKECSPFRLRGTNPRKVPFGWVDVDIVFHIQHRNLIGSAAGIISVVPCTDGEWRIWILRTWLECFEGHGHPDQAKYPNQIDSMPNGTSGAADDVYGAIVVGAGQAGLSLGGRLQALGVKYLVLEKTPQVGDVWRNRYDSLRFHTPKEYNVLPFEWRFPVEDDKNLPTKRIGAGHQAWAEMFGINIRTSTTVESASYDETSEIWTVHATTPEGKQIYKAKNLVLAIGLNSTQPSFPVWASQDKIKASGFTGDIIHGSAWKSAQAWAGKRGIVVGVANTGHDVAEDMADAGMVTTMVQRGATFVIPVEWLHAILDRDYNAEKLTTVADRENVTVPNKITREIANMVIQDLIRANPERFDALEKQGFRVDRTGDLYGYLFERSGGHYVDIGCSARIAKGEIKVESKPIKGLSQHGLVFEDGTEVPADVIVIATGFKRDFRGEAARLIGQKSAEVMDDYGGLDSEGEIRGLARPSARKLYTLVYLTRRLLTLM